ncbi:DUF1405 domain-containing protein [Halarchaeum salinum]|uniref:DUF1405 domain-containing protein n=1 Tax=Halarchaeum salinum TaxID=489912 RepID=A0AAV3S9X6_9EURY
MSALPAWLFRPRETLPATDDLPWYVAPLPTRLEDLGLRLVWPVVAANVLGTLFGFWYYVPQFSVEPTALWLFVPDSPMATLFIACSLALWASGRGGEWVHALAFYGCLILGLWTPFALLVFHEGFSYLPLPMYAFLCCSHLAMAIEAFVVQRYADFPVRAVAVAFAWYLVNLLLDYFVPVLGTPHHTFVPAESVGYTVGSFLGQPLLSGPVVHPSGAHALAAAGAVTVTLLATFLALATRVAKLRVRARTAD